MSERYTYRVRLLARGEQNLAAIVAVLKSAKVSLEGRRILEGMAASQVALIHAVRRSLPPPSRAPNSTAGVNEDGVMNR